MLKDFYKALTYFDNSHIKKICGEIALNVILDGAYYGYIVPSKIGVILQQLPVRYCRSRYKSDGMPAVEFNMQYFDTIASRPEPKHAAIPQLTHPQKNRAVIEDDVQLPRLVMLWHSPAFLSDGDAELDILSSILTKGKNSRLINKLVYEHQLASSVQAGQISSRASMFMIDAVPLPGVSIETLEKAILDELNAILTNGVTQSEFDKTRNSIETSYIKQLQSIGSRADNFNNYYFYSGTTAFPAADLERYHKASIPSLMSVTKTIFSDDTRRATIIVVPKQDGTNATVAKESPDAP